MDEIIELGAYGQGDEGMKWLFLFVCHLCALDFMLHFISYVYPSSLLRRLVCTCACACGCGCGRVLFSERDTLLCGVFLRN